MSLSPEEIQGICIGMQYQQENCQTFTTNEAELREFVVNKVTAYEQITKLILQLKSDHNQEFYDV